MNQSNVFYTPDPELSRYNGARVLSTRVEDPTPEQPEALLIELDNVGETVFVLGYEDEVVSSDFMDSLRHM